MEKINGVDCIEKKAFVDYLRTGMGYRNLKKFTKVCIIHHFPGFIIALWQNQIKMMEFILIIVFYHKPQWNKVL